MNHYFSFFSCVLFLLSTISISPSFYTSSEERDLELFASPTNSHAGFTALFEKYARTNAGREELKKLFMSPVSDVNFLTARQNAIRELTSDEAFVSLTSFCERVHANESSLDALVTFNTNPAFHDVLKTFYFNWAALKGLNNSRFALNALYYGELMTQLGPIFEHLLLHELLGGCGHDHSHDHAPKGKCADHEHCHHHDAHHGHDHHDHDDHDHDEESGISAAYQKFRTTLHNTIQAHPTLMQGIAYAHIPVLIFSLVGSMKFNGERRTTINHIHRELVGLAAVVAAARELACRATAVPGLEEYAVRIKVLLESKDSSFGECISLLESSTFKTHSSAWVLSPVGKTLQTLVLVLKHQDEFKKLMTLVGGVDALRAASEVVRTSSMPWSYTEFVESEAPRINFEAMRNPLLAAEKSVADNCVWGAGSESHVILTGPNRAGKTTYLKALAYNVLLSHVFGIACAQKASMTPFKGIVTFMSLNDDLVNDKSRYVAQIARMDGIVSRVNECKEHEFMLVLLDDSVGQGSTQEVNEKIAYEFFKVFGAYHNVVFIGATHFARLTELEAETFGTYKNYRMRVVPSVDGVQAASAYAVEPGIADFGQILALV